MNILRIAVVLATVAPHLAEEICLHLMIPSTDRGSIDLDYEWILTHVHRVADGDHAGFAHDAKIIAELIEFGMQKNSMGQGAGEWVWGRDRLINSLKMQSPNDRVSYTLNSFRQNEHEPRIITFSFVRIANLM